MIQKSSLLLLWCYTEVHMSYTHISPSTKLCHMQWCHTAVHLSLAYIHIVHKLLQGVILNRTTHIRSHPHCPQNYLLKWCYTEVHMSRSCPTHLSTKLSNEAVLHTGSLLCVSFRPCKELPMFIMYPTHLNTHQNCPQNHVILSGVIQSFQRS